MTYLFSRIAIRLALYAAGLMGGLGFGGMASAADIVFFPEEGPVVPAYA